MGREWELRFRLGKRPRIAVANSAPVAAATAVFLNYPIGQGSFSDGMPLGISGYPGGEVKEGERRSEEGHPAIEAAPHSHQLTSPIPSPPRRRRGDAGGEPQKSKAPIRGREPRR